MADVSQVGDGPLGSLSLVLLEFFMYLMILGYDFSLEVFNYFLPDFYF